MGDLVEEWEIQEQSSSEGSKSKATWILDKGLNIGKKIVITGIVISSAPLVLPPLVVISAIGFAFSVPSGILLSSYVCTEKLMSKLFPLLLEDGTSSVEEKEEEFGFEEDEICEAKGEIRDDEYYWAKGVEDDRNLVESGAASAKEEGYEEDVGEYLDIVHEKEKPSVEEKTRGEQPPENLVHQTVLSLGGDEKNKIQVSVTDDVKVEDKDVGEKVSTGMEEKEKERKAEAVAAEVKSISSTERNKESGNRTVVAEKTVGNIANETNKKSTKKKKGNKKLNNAQEEPRMDNEKEKKVVQPSAEIAVETPQDISKLRGSARVPESKQPGVTPSGKVVLTPEGKMWERLDALRAIVGYKASHQATYIGELKALYMFTGVEPPVSFKDPSELGEVNDKLEFLMSVVGVK